MSRQVKKVNISGKEDKSNKVISWSSTTTDAHYPSEKLVKDSLDGKASSTHNHTKSQITDFPSLSTVATTGSYSDLSNKPTIPSASSTTPSADTKNGSVGTGTTYAKADHTHPKSSLYAEATHTHSQYLTEHQDLSDYVTTDDSRLSDARTPTSHTHTKSQITDFPTIPSASSTVPSADTTNGSYGSGTSYARSNHTHPKSSLYAESSHTHSQYLTEHQSLANYVQKSSTSGLLKNNGSVDTTQYLSSLPSHNHDDRYYTESEVDTALNGKANSSHTHTKSQITDFPTIPSKTSDLTNDSGFLTSHQSLTGYLQQSDVKDNLTSTDTNKPLSANQGKQLKTLIDSKEDNIEIFTGSVVRTSSTSAFLKAYTSSSIIIDKIILYKVPDISSIEQTTNVALDYYMNNQTTTFNRKYIYKNGVQLTFGEIESNSWLLLAYESTLTNGQWNLVSSSSYTETESNKVTSISSSSTDTQYPSAKCVYDELQNTIGTIVDMVYPVGSIYMSVSNTSPSILFGGQWEQIEDMFLLASGSTYANGTTGGSADATLVSHQHGSSYSGEYFVTSEKDGANNTRVTYSSSGNRYVDGMNDNTTPFHHRIGTGYVGSSATGKNMPPYLAVNVWKRIA